MELDGMVISLIYIFGFFYLMSFLSEYYKDTYIVSYLSSFKLLFLLLKGFFVLTIFCVFLSVLTELLTGTSCFEMLLDLKK